MCRLCRKPARTSALLENEQLIRAKHTDNAIPREIEKARADFEADDFLLFFFPSQLKYALKLQLTSTRAFKPS